MKITWNASIIATCIPGRFGHCNLKSAQLHLLRLCPPYINSTCSMSQWIASSVIGSVVYCSIRVTSNIVWKRSKSLRSNAPTPANVKRQRCVSFHLPIENRSLDSFLPRQQLHQRYSTQKNFGNSYSERCITGEIIHVPATAPKILLSSCQSRVIPLQLLSWCQGRWYHGCWMIGQRYEKGVFILGIMLRTIRDKLYQWRCLGYICTINSYWSIVEIKRWNYSLDTCILLDCRECWTWNEEGTLCFKTFQFFKCLS